MQNLKIVVDIGANRGAFSALMTSRADYILSAELSSQYIPIIEHGFRVNNFTNYSVENVFVGSDESKLDDRKINYATISEMFDRHNINIESLVKMDIEGGEFAIFKSPNWLNRVNAITMEVHQREGAVGDIVSTLIKHDFQVVMADENLNEVQDALYSNFIYAWKDAAIN